MSFIKITTTHPTGRKTTGITQQTNVTAREAFDNRVKRLRYAPGGYDADGDDLAIHLQPTDVVDYEQLLEYVETIDGFNDGEQPGLFEVRA